MPTLGNNGVPRLGTTFSVTLASARGNAVALHCFGFSDTVWGAVPLPLSLTLLGAPGCAILASGEIVTAVTTSPSGTAPVPYSIPNSASLLNATFFNQFLVHDPPANQLGLVSSNGGRGVIGNL